MVNEIDKIKQKLNTMNLILQDAYDEGYDEGWDD